MQEESRWRTAIQVVLFALLGAAILYFMWQAQGSAYAEDCALRGIQSENCSLFDKLVEDFRNTHVVWLFVISVCFTMSQLFRAIRWRYLLRPMGFEVSLFNAFATLMVGYLVNLGIPRIGELVRAGLIAKYEEVAIEKAFATIVIERIVDVILLFCMILLGFFFHFDVLWEYLAQNLVISNDKLIKIGVAIIIMGILGIWMTNKLISLDDDGLHPILRKIKKLITGFIEGIKEIRNLPNVGAFVAYSVGIWVMYFLMHYLAFFAFDPVSHLSVIDGILVFDFGSLGVVFPSPGGMGSYHFMIVESLEILGVNTVDGFSFAMITFFTLTIFCTIIIGLICLILLPIVHNKR